LWTSNSFKLNFLNVSVSNFLLISIWFILSRWWKFLCFGLVYYINRICNSSLSLLFWLARNWNNWFFKDWFLGLFFSYFFLVSASLGHLCSLICSFLASFGLISFNFSDLIFQWLCQSGNFSIMFILILHFINVIFKLSFFDGNIFLFVNAFIDFRSDWFIMLNFDDFGINLFDISNFISGGAVILSQ